MSEPVKTPAFCQTMQDVRDGVDATDRALVDLLATRFAYMRAAARIKPNREDVRDEARKRAVIAAAVAEADARGLPVAPIAALWDDLVEASIAYEAEEWERQRSDR